MASETLENQGFMFIKRKQQELTVKYASHSINDIVRLSKTEETNKYDSFTWLLLIKRHFQNACISTAFLLVTYYFNS